MLRKKVKVPTCVHRHSQCLKVTSPLPFWLAPRLVWQGMSDVSPCSCSTCCAVTEGRHEGQATITLLPLLVGGHSFPDSCTPPAPPSQKQKQIKSNRTHSTPTDVEDPHFAAVVPFPPTPPPPVLDIPCRLSPGHIFVAAPLSPDLDTSVV